MDYRALFHLMHPGFFDKPFIRDLDPEDVFAEQIMALSGFDPNAVDIPIPPDITFGFYQGDMAALHAAVLSVDEDWPQYFRKQDRVFCAFREGKIAGFCLLDDMGEYDLDGKHIRISGPGCVGTVPAFRRQGIGLKMVQLATGILKEEGYDYSYIHFTGVEGWYAKIGYKTILHWNFQGILPD